MMKQGHGGEILHLDLKVRGIRIERVGEREGWREGGKRRSWECYKSFLKPQSQSDTPPPNKATPPNPYQTVPLRTKYSNT